MSALLFPSKVSHEHQSRSGRITAHRDDCRDRAARRSIASRWRRRQFDAITLPHSLGHLRSFQRPENRHANDRIQSTAAIGRWPLEGAHPPKRPLKGRRRLSTPDAGPTFAGRSAEQVLPTRSRHPRTANVLRQNAVSSSDLSRAFPARPTGRAGSCATHRIAGCPGGRSTPAPPWTRSHASAPASPARAP